MKTNDGGGELLPLPSISDRLINPNGGFEESTLGEKFGWEISGWELTLNSPASAKFEVVDNPTYEGNRALKVTAEQIGSDPWNIQAVNDPFDVTPNTEYTYSVWVKADKWGARLNFTIGDPLYNEWYNLSNFTVDTDWHRATFKFTTPSNVSKGRAPIHMGGFLNSGYLPVIFYIDDLEILKPAGLVDVNTNYNIDHSYSLSQNYPNPFNPSTTISYTISQTPPISPLYQSGDKGGFVTLKVYDILGREVATLVNEYQLPGKYNVEFNIKTFHQPRRDRVSTGATSLPSAVYFYTLVIRDISLRSVFSETKKMLLIK
ncbi:MAG: carbohydrate binding domain-containing protein [Bacteroidota bacterium]